MALNLHPKAKDKLRQSLVDSLEKIKVDNSIFLDYPSALSVESANKILPSGNLQNNLQQYIGENSLFNFVFETIGREIFENGTFEPDKTGIPLKSFTNYDDLVSVATHLVDEFDSLPWSYLISLELPISVGTAIKDAMPNYSISSFIRLVTPDDSYDYTFPLQSGINQRDKWLFGGPLFLASLNLPKWNMETVYIQIDVEGFVGRYLRSSPINEAISTIKSFIGLSLATRLMKLEKEKVLSSLFGALTKKNYLIVHRKMNGKWQIWSTYELPADLTEAINKLEINDIEGRLKPEHVADWIKNRLPIISTAFLYQDKAEQVLLASQWLMDSYVGNNDLLAFVQTTVAMEIMLGEKSKSDILGIGELIRNRCAYLIGKTHSQRKRILEEFAEIYDVRSKIVHRGKSGLTSKELDLFEKLRWMCRSVINKELELISVDEKPNT